VLQKQQKQADYIREKGVITSHRAQQHPIQIEHSQGGAIGPMTTDHDFSDSITIDSRDSPESITKDPYQLPDGGEVTRRHQIPSTSRPDSKYLYNEDEYDGIPKSSGTLSKKTPVLPMTSSSYMPRGALVQGGTRFNQAPPQQSPYKMEDDYGTSSTETLVQPLASPVTSPQPKTQKVTFVDNNIDYTSSQETYSASNPGMATILDERPGITVYY